jgi:uncharacterized repeat protein (TIGR03943 family)
MTGKEAIGRSSWLMVAALWGLFLVGMFHWDKLKYFQASPYLYFTAAAGAVLVALALKGVLWPSRAAGGHHHGRGASCPVAGDEAAASDAGTAAGPPGTWTMAKGIALVVFVMAPVLAGILVPHRSLNTLAAMKRGMGLDSDDLLDVYRTKRRKWAEAAGQYNATNTLEVLEIGRDKPGVRVRCVGMVYRSDAMPADVMSIVRFKITCCAADAAPISVAVRWPKARELANDTWVEVRGRVARQVIETSDGARRESTVIVVDPQERPNDGVLVVEAPDSPYI